MNIHPTFMRVSFSGGILRTMKRATFLLPAVALAVLGLGDFVSADTPQAVALPSPGGRLLSASCFQCHSSGGFEEITGKNPGEIISELREMRTRRSVEGIMDLIARGLTDAQIAEIAAYLSTLPEGKDSD